MKKSFLKNKFILLTYLFTFLIPILNSTQIPVNAANNSTDISLQESDERNVDTMWIYKTVNGKKYKRLYNTKSNRWLTDWIPV